MQSLRSLDDLTATLGQSLCRVVRDLAAQGWCQGTGGNFSVTLSREPLRLLITRSGLHKRHLDPEGLMIVGPGGNAVEGETARPSAPSAEAALHAVIVERTGAASVLHVHSELALGQVAHVAHRGPHDIVPAQELVDRLRLGGRFDDDQ